MIKFRKFRPLCLTHYRVVFSGKRKRICKKNGQPSELIVDSRDDKGVLYIFNVWPLEPDVTIYACYIGGIEKKIVYRNHIRFRCYA